MKILSAIYANTLGMRQKGQNTLDPYALVTLVFSDKVPVFTPDGGIELTEEAGKFTFMADPETLFRLAERLTEIGTAVEEAEGLVVTTQADAEPAPEAEPEASSA